MDFGMLKLKEIYEADRVLFLEVPGPMKVEFQLM